MPEPKIALFDIETAPSLGFYFDRWKENNIIETVEGGYLLSFAVKWLGQKSIKVRALSDYKRGPYHPDDDKNLAKELWSVFDEADYLVAHNGRAFDIRTARARFLYHNFKPPSPFGNIDTLKIARQFFKIESNKLDSLGSFLGVGRKLPTMGKDTWLGCMRGEEKSWAIMRRYNAQDVALLERIYLKLRPWATTHPDLNFITRAQACPTCQSPRVQNRGFCFTRTGKRQRIQCTACGNWSTAGTLIKVA